MSYIEHQFSHPSILSCWGVYCISDIHRSWHSEDEDAMASWKWVSLALMLAPLGLNRLTVSAETGSMLDQSRQNAITPIVFRYVRSLRLCKVTSMESCALNVFDSLRLLDFVPTYVTSYATLGHYGCKGRGSV